MTTTEAAIAATAFLACAVECVEALTIVLAVGVTRGWPRALGGAALAVAVLALAVAIAGPRLAALVAIGGVKIAIGAVALYLGITWLRKAVLRAAGRKALRDESAAYARERERLSRGEGAAAFATAFNGVFIEGVEIVAIVLALGNGGGAGIAAASAGAAVALALVLVAGVLLHRPLARVPENALKYVVGILLTGFGIFWIGEGAGLAWPGEDASLPALAAAVALAALATTAALRARTQATWTK